MVPLLILLAEATPPPPVPVEVVVDTTGNARAFEHKWKRSFGSGHASLSLRDDWRAHLTLAKSELGLSGVRYHGLFDDDMAVVTAPNTYNFTLLGSTWDFLLQKGVHPIVELSFMPAFVANCTWHGHCKPDPKGCTGYWCTQCNGHGVGPIVNPTAPRNCSRLEFWYQGIKEVPYNNDFGRWYDLVRRTVTYAVQRYGLAEVQRWSFEVWNELWGMPFPDPYMALYNASARAIKAVHPSLKVGGPATAVLAHVEDFVKACQAESIPFDFVSTHHYPTDSCPTGAAWDPDCFNDGVLTSRRTVPSSLPFLLTEYNVGCCLGYVGHDLATAAAFVLRSVGALNDALDVYSYWTFTDVFEEGGMSQIEYKNVYGAMSISGVPKPVWRAFELLHKHAGSFRLPVKVSNQSEAPTVLPSAAAAGGDDGKRWAVAVACNASDPRQTSWSYDGGAWQWKDADGHTLCMDSIDSTAALELTPCVYLQPSQTFEQHGATYVQAGSCLDVYLPDPAQARRIDLYRCNGGANQQFHLAGSARSLHSANGACVAASSSPVGPPPPPPPPPPGPKPYVSAFATRNETAGGAGLASLRVFLSFWAEPTTTPDPLLASRAVALYVEHSPLSVGEAADPPHATIHSIDDEHVHPRATWEALGKPDRPNATELAALMAASKVREQHSVEVRRVNATTLSLHVTMAPNSVAVVQFS